MTASIIIIYLYSSTGVWAYLLTRYLIALEDKQNWKPSKWLIPFLPSIVMAWLTFVIIMIGLVSYNPSNYDKLKPL